MKNKNPRILILGVAGMLGRTVYKYLSKLYGKKIMGTSRDRKSKTFIYLNFKKRSDLKTIFNNQKFDYVINCIGVLRGSANKKDMRLTNSDLPRVLDKYCQKNEIKLIHVSTDAVFSDLSSNVYENSKPDSSDYYGKTKLKGEVKTGINIRTSFLGFDPVKKKGLLEFVLKNKDKKIIGFTNQTWSGSTTLQLAKFIKWLTSDNNFSKINKKTNVIHFAPLGPVTKHEVIKTFLKMINRSNVVKDEGPRITRTLKSKYVEDFKLKEYTKSLKEVFRELMVFDQGYVKVYKKN